MGRGGVNTLRSTRSRFGRISLVKWWLGAFLGATVVLMPGAELVRVPGIGHVPMYDEPAEVARLILEVTAACDAAEESAS